MALLPAAIPLTVPVALIVAIVITPLPHVPPVVASLNVVLLPAHIVAIPVIGCKGFTVTITVAAQPAVVR